MASLYPILLNNVSSTVQAGSSAIGSASATGINVATGDGAKFGTIGTNCFIPAVVLDTSTNPETVKEYVYITAISTDALTVTRAAESATAYPASTTTIAAGYTIAAVATAGTLNKSAGRPRKSANWYYAPFGATAEVSSTLMTLNQEYSGNRFEVAPGQGVSGLGVFVNTAGSAGAVLRFGLRSDNGDGTPGTLLVDGGTAAATTSGAYSSVTFTAWVNNSNTTLIVWPVIAAQGAPATAPTVQSLANDVINGDIVGGGSSIGASNNIGEYTGTATESGALPSSPPTWTRGNGYKLWFQAA